MKTVKQVSELTGVSVRTLHHYDALGLLKPTQVSDAGYRLYDEEAIERLHLILLFRELRFPLGQIRGILDAPDFDRNRVLEQQIDLLQKRVEYLKNRIDLAKGIKMIGVKFLELDGLTLNKVDDYAAQAKTLYGKTEAYKEYTLKSAGRTEKEEAALGEQVMDFFVRLGAMRDKDPGSDAVQAWVKELQSFFTTHYYTCTPQILKGLGEGYGGGGSLNENIDAAGGIGTGAFAHRAIEIYCEE